ncbi:MAG TPA: hypothetical protein VF530_20940 [Planctomycetota bacterium]
MSSGRLERISIERPCPKRWSELVGDERRRFCSACALHVTNLSALTRTEAEGFLAASRGRVCVTYVPTDTGAVALRRAPGRAHRLLRPLARAASLLLGLVFLLPGCRPAERPADPVTPPPDDAQPGDGHLLGKVRADPVCQVDDDQRMIMGEMVAPEPQAPPAEPVQE